MMAMGKMLSEIFDVSLEEAVEVIAIQLTNGFELNLPSMSGRALYPKISFINHSCVPNAEFDWNENISASVIRTVSEIKAGEEITVNYRPEAVLTSKITKQMDFSKLW